MSEKIFIVTPVGRIVQGDLYEPNTTNQQGEPLVVKSGPNKGQPREEIFFALAIPKGSEKAWWETPWGAQILAAAQRDWPAGQFQNQNFAWKVIDGDSTQVDQGGKRPCDKTGFKGHWVLRLSSGFTPTICNSDGTQQITQRDAVRPGDYVQVQISVAGNDNAQKPGMFLNHHAIAFVAYGERIEFKVDTASIGFGKGVQMPAGASTTPPAGAFNPVAPAVPGVAAAPAAAPMVAAAPYQAPAAAPAVPGMMPAPAPEVLMPPVMAPAPAPMPAAPAPRTMTAKAAGQPYEAFKASGWTDEQLVQHGYMVA